MSGTAPHDRAPCVHAAMSAESFAALFDDARLSRLAGLADIGSPLLLDSAADPTLEDPSIQDALAETEVLITSWGAPRLDADLLARLPRLRAVLHAAGSIRGIVTPEFWARGIPITSAADANAAPVAEFALGMILLAGKRTLVHAREGISPEQSGIALLDDTRIGNMDRTIGIVGFSRIGRRVVELLRPFDGLTALVADPFADADEVARAGASLLPLEHLLPRAQVLSLHAPALESTAGMIGRAQLAALPDRATVINTARGALLDHDALYVECRTARLDAVLDVTDPEPLPADHGLRTLANVTITPHIAGSLGTEIRRLADSALDELEALTRGLPLRHTVSEAEAARSA